MKKVIVLTLVILTATCYTKLQAQKPAVVDTNKPGWHHIGHTTASFKTQNESISVLGADEFSALKIKVSEAPVHIQRLQVFYESGDMEEIDVRKHFANGTESTVINLKHPDKDIQKVAFTYNTEANAQGEKADIDLYGLKTHQPAGRDAYRDDADEAREDVIEKTREAGEELEEESREAREEINEEARETESELERDTASVGDKLEEGAKDAAAAITDQKLKNKVGPGGETAYVDENGKYYYINNSGEKVFITKAQLRDKKIDR